MLDPFFGMAEHFDLSDARERLAALPEVEGSWPFPASLSRFGYDEMPAKMLRRFVKKIQLGDLGYVVGTKPSPCWIWTGGLHDKGYGRFWLGVDPDTSQRIWAYAHRIAFEHWIGFPPPGYIVDHQCNVKTCCNPIHLWPETNADNLRLADERRPWKRRNQYSKE
jgi:hypothetical protein